jgi:integrase
MSRPNHIWFRSDIGWWCITLNGQKVRLAEGKENRAEAERKFHELKAVAPRLPESRSARVSDVIEAFLVWAERHRSPETLRNFRWYGQMFAEKYGYLPVGELRPMHLTRWVDERKWGPTTERNARRSIARAFSWACEEGILSQNPLKGMKCPRAKTRDRAMTDEEFRILMRHSDRDFKIFLYVLRATGCRPKEARTLKWPQVREDRWILQEHKTVGKTGKPRIIYLTRSVQKLMALLRRETSSEHVFLNGRSMPWTTNAVRLRIGRIKAKGILADDVCSYLLRHAFGTNAILNGVDALTVAELLGHSSLDMVRTVYVHLAEERTHLQAAAEKAARSLGPPKPQSGERRQAGENQREGDAARATSRTVQPGIAI